MGTDLQKARHEESVMRWRAKNLEKVRADTHRYYLKNKARIQEYKRQWYLKRKKQRLETDNDNR